MRLFYDLTLRQFVTAPGDSALPSVDLKSRDQIPLELAFCRGKDAAELVGTSPVIELAIKINASGPALTLATEWDFEVDAWVGLLDLNTVPFVNALAGSHRSKRTFYAELKITDDTGGPVRSQTLQINAERALIDGTEDTPADLPDPDEYYTKSQVDMLIESELELIVGEQLPGEVAEQLPGALAAYAEDHDITGPQGEQGPQGGVGPTGPVGPPATEEQLNELLPPALADYLDQNPQVLIAELRKTTAATHNDADPPWEDSEPWVDITVDPPMFGVGPSYNGGLSTTTAPEGDSSGRVASTAFVTSADNEIRISHTHVAETKSVFVTANTALDAYLDRFEEEAGNPNAPSASFVPFCDNELSPINLFTDADATVPALVSGDIVKAIKDPNTGSVFVHFYGPVPTLRFDSAGRPVVRCADACYGIVPPAEPYENVTGMWAVFRKDMVDDHNALLGQPDPSAWFGLWDGRRSDKGFGWMCAGNLTLDQDPEWAYRYSVANEENLDFGIPRLHTGFLFNGKAHYACNGRVHRAVSHETMPEGTNIVTTIGYIAENVGWSTRGDLYGFAISQSPNLTPRFVDSINAQFGRLLKIPITSSLRKLVVCTGNSITVGAQAGPNNSYPDQMQRWLGQRFRVENVAMGGWQDRQLLVADFERRYDDIGRKICVYWEFTNRIMGNAPDRSNASSLETCREFYLQKKSEGYFVMCLTVLPRADGTVPAQPDGYTPADFAIKVAALNAILKKPESIGFYFDQLIRIDEDSRFQDPYNTTIFADLVHLTSEGCKLVAEEHVGPAILNI